MKLLLLSLNWVEYQIEMANALTALGHRCEVVFKSDRVRESVGDELPRLLHPNVIYHLLDDRPRGLRDPRQWLTIARLVRILRGARADVLLIHEAGTTYLPMALALAPRRPILLTIHDVASHPGADSREPGRRRRVRDHLRRRASAVVVHGERLLREYLALPGDICRDATAIPHGCYTVLRHWAKDPVPEITDSILFFGRIHEYKGLEWLLRAVDLAAARVPGLKLIIAGDGADLDGRLRDVLANPRCIVHRGYLPNDRVARVFQEASLVVLPYIEGSQSGVVRIAYVFGKPVIVTDVGSIAESVRDGVTGLVVPPRDAQALAAAIASLLLEDDRRRSMSRAAAAMTSGEMSWESVARRTEPILARIAKRGSGDQGRHAILSHRWADRRGSAEQ